MGAGRSSSRLAGSRRDDPTSRPSPLALDELARAAREVDHHDLLLRRAALRSDRKGDVTPATESLRRTGGQDSAQLKLWLVLLWLLQHRGGRGPYAPHVWARLCDFPESAASDGSIDTHSAGMRRVRRAFRALEARELVTSDGGDGSHRSEVRLLSDTGDGSTYSLPRGRWIEVPKFLFTRGWISALSGPALCAWLILREAADMNDPALPIWLAPSVRNEVYRIGEDAWLAGLAELGQHGLVERHQRSVRVGDGLYDWARREHLTLNLEAIRDNQPNCSFRR